MRIGTWRFCAAIIAAACAASCTGNGDGLDQNGQPITSGSSSSGGTVTADFESIQENVFTPICSKCHIGAGAPEGLQLDAAHSYNLLVGVPSTEQPELDRVKPGDPDDSYMVRKIEGLAGIQGGQMPLGETPLPQATIDAIRQWITNGAPNAASAAAVAANSVFAVVGVTPGNAAVVRSPVRRVVVAFTQELDATLLNETTVALERIGDNAQRIVAASALAEHNPSVLLISPASALGAGVYRVTLRGAGGAALANLSADTLGVDVSWEFTVAVAP
jgi:hypothetical protein